MNLKLRMVVIIAFFIIHFSLFIIPVFASEDIGQSRIDPASPFYFLKTIREKWEISHALSANMKLLKQLEFSTRRLREVKALIFTTHQDLIETTLIRYQSHLGQLPDKDISDASYAIRIRDALVIHLNVLQNIYDQVGNGRARRAIRSTVYVLTKRENLPKDAKLSACQFLSKEAFSSALNQTESVVWKDRVQKCFNSLNQLTL